MPALGLLLRVAGMEPVGRELLEISVLLQRQSAALDEQAKTLHAREAALARREVGLLSCSALLLPSPATRTLGTAIAYWRRDLRPLSFGPKGAWLGPYATAFRCFRRSWRERLALH